MQSQAQAALGAIFNAIKMCRQDFGLDPGSVEELERLDYLVLSDDLKQYWSFRLVGHNPITQIYAESTDQFPPGPGYTIIFTAQTGVFSGYGISEDLTNLLTCVFQSIRLGVEHYVSDHQQYPVSMDVLLAQNYVRISPDLLAGWDFIPVHWEHRMISIHAVARIESETDGFNLVSYNFADDQFEFLMIQNPDAQLVIRILPALMKGIYLFEANQGRRPDSFSGIMYYAGIEYTDSLMHRFSPSFITLEKNFQIRFQPQADRYPEMEDAYRYILSLGTFTGGEFPRSDLSDILVSFAEIHLSAGAISYRYLSFNELLEAEALVIEEEVLNRWDFFLSQSVYDVERVNAISKEFNSAYDFHFATLKFESFDRYPAKFSASRAVDPGVKSLVEEMMRIIEAIFRYRFDHRQDVPAVASLVEAGYLELDEQLNRDWYFSLIGTNPVTSLEAYSKADVPDSLRDYLIYDFTDGEFWGSGMEQQSR